jgi:hypothetical protein
MLSPLIRLGTSTWTYECWQGGVQQDLSPKYTSNGASQSCNFRSLGPLLPLISLATKVSRHAHPAAHGGDFDDNLHDGS